MCAGNHKNYIVSVTTYEGHEVRSDIIMHAIADRIGIDKKYVNVVVSPFCDNCKEEDCTVSNDDTCAMIRVYLGAKKGFEPIARPE